jgi:hypothetical protein
MYNTWHYKMWTLHIWGKPTTNHVEISIIHLKYQNLQSNAQKIERVTPLPQRTYHIHLGMHLYYKNVIRWWTQDINGAFTLVIYIEPKKLQNEDCTYQLWHEGPSLCLTQDRNSPRSWKLNQILVDILSFKNFEMWFLFHLMIQ